MFLVLLGSLWFWCVLTGLILLFVCTAKEWSIGGLVVIAATILTLQLVGVDILSWVKENTRLVVIGTLVYFPIGTVWSFVKWYLRLKDEKESLIEKKEDYVSNVLRELKEHRKEIRYSMHGFNHEDLKDKNDEELFALSIDVWKEHVNNKRPKAAENKYIIMTWIGYWPTSMIWTLLDDFLTKIVKTIYNHISGVFNTMSEKVFSDM